jgi:hypothetical protein
MSWQVDELTSWWVDKLMSWQVDELTSWWVDKLMSWQAVEPTSICFTSWYDDNFTSLEEKSYYLKLDISTQYLHFVAI